MAAIVDISLFPGHSVGLHWLKTIVHTHSKVALCGGRRKYQNLYSCHLVPESRLWESFTDRGWFRVQLLVNFWRGSEGRRAGEGKRKKLGCGPVPVDTQLTRRELWVGKAFQRPPESPRRCHPPKWPALDAGCPANRCDPGQGSSLQLLGILSSLKGSMSGASASVRFGSLVFVLKVQNKTQG